MKKNILGNTGLEVTEIGFGVLTVGNTQLNLSIDEGSSVLRYALERGINFLDTAQYYETYPYIKKALKGTNFDPVIASKCLDVTYKDMIFAVEEARKEIDRDVIDIFLLHEVRGEDDFKIRSGAWEALQESKAKGIIKNIGISTHHVDVAELCSEISDLDVLFPLINFKSLGIRHYNNQGKKEDMAAAIEKASSKGIGVFAMKAFGGGNLTGNYIEALDYVTKMKGVDSTMIGFGYHSEIDQIFDYCDGLLSKDFTPDISKKKINIDMGDCEGCGICIERCPNKAIAMSNKNIAVVDHDICLTCGYCAPVCPVRAIIMF